MGIPLSGFAAAPFSRIAAQFGKGDAASARQRSAACAAWRPLRGGRWSGLRQLQRPLPQRNSK